MTNEEIKQKLALTEEQQKMVNLINKLMQEAKEMNIGFVFDMNLGSMNFAAFNNTNVLEMDNEGELQDQENAVNVEDCVEFGNVFNESFYIYDSYYTKLYAVFGEKSSVNESMMSASL